MRMLPSSSLTVPDVQLSRFRFLWKSFAREGVAMDDPGCRQGVTLSEGSELVPKEPTPAIPPRQPFLPNPRDLIGIPAYSSKVARYAVIGIVAPHHRGQMGALVRDRLM